MSDSDRFWDKVAWIGAGDDDCWLFMGSINAKRYGSFRFRGKTSAAHRVAWILTHGDPASELHVLHHCDMPQCVNPAHLYLGTNQDNVNDRERRGRRRTGWVPGEMNGMSVLTDSDVREIRALAADGWTLARLHDRYGVSCARLSQIVRGIAWAHLLEDSA